MELDELAHLASRAIALAAARQSNFRIRRRDEQLSQAGDVLYEKIGSRVRVARTYYIPYDRRFPSLALSLRRSGPFAGFFVARDAVLIAKSQASIIETLLADNPMLAISVADTLKVEYSPPVGEPLAELGPVELLTQSARRIRLGLTGRSVDIVNLIFTPENASPDDISILYALFMAYLSRDADFATFRAELFTRYKEFRSRTPARLPVVDIRHNASLESFLEKWLPLALFYHNMRPADNVLQALISAKVLQELDSGFISPELHVDLEALMGLILDKRRRESIALKKDPASPSKDVAEEIGDIDAVSSILDRILNWMGPPPTPLLSRAGSPVGAL